MSTKVLRQLQPAHPSENFTLEQAREAWRIVKEAAVLKTKNQRVVTPKTSPKATKIASSKK